MIVLLRHFVGWRIGAFQSREDLILENLALRQQLLTVPAKRPRRRLGSIDRGVLGLATKAGVGVEETTYAGHPRNGGALASPRLPGVLGLAFAKSLLGREETLE